MVKKLLLLIIFMAARGDCAQQEPPSAEQQQTAAPISTAASSDVSKTHVNASMPDNAAPETSSNSAPEKTIPEETKAVATDGIEIKSAVAEGVVSSSMAVDVKSVAVESTVIARGARIYIAAMPSGFDSFLRTAMDKKKVPVTVVEKKETADFEISGHSETQKAGAAKIILMGSWHSRESASIQVTNLTTSTVVYAYSYNNTNSAHGKRTSAESCAKHLKEKVESGK